MPSMASTYHAHMENFHSGLFWLLHYRPGSLVCYNNNNNIIISLCVAVLLDANVFKPEFSNNIALCGCDYHLACLD